MPCACSVAPVVRIMKYIRKLEKNMPVTTSLRARRNSARVAPWRLATVVFPSARSSSTSCAACQKNRKGEMLVPRMPTSTEIFARKPYVRCESGVPHLPPIRAHDEGGHHVGEQHQRQPLENARDLAVRSAEQHHNNEDRENRRQPQRIDAGDQVGGIRHAAQVGA